MALKTLGEWRKEIDRNEVIQRIVPILKGKHGVDFASILDEHFPAGSNEVVFAEQLKVRTILCGNNISKGKNHLAMLGGLIQGELLRVLGFEAEAISVEMD